jgi:hypothetical protein
VCTAARVGRLHSRADARPEASGSGRRVSARWVSGLFLIGDVLQHQAGELRHQRPQAGVFFQKPDHAGIEIAVKAVVVAETRWRKPLALRRADSKLTMTNTPQLTRNPAEFEVFRRPAKGTKLPKFGVLAWDTLK